MTAAPVSLGPDELGEVFPFHFALDSSLAVVQAGRAWSRILPAVAAAARFDDLFEIVRPAVPADFHLLAELSGSVFVLNCRGLDLRLRGQLRASPSADGDRLLFLGHPWVTDVEHLTRFGLTINDFPAYEPVSDYLLLIQSQKQALTEAAGDETGLPPGRYDLFAAQLADGWHVWAAADGQIVKEALRVKVEPHPGRPADARQRFRAKVWG